MLLADACEQEHVGMLLWFAVPRRGTANQSPGAGSVQQAGDGPGAYRPAALPDGEAEPRLERDRLAQLDRRAHPVTVSANCSTERCWAPARAS